MTADGSATFGIDLQAIVDPGVLVSLRIYVGGEQAAIRRATGMDVDVIRRFAEAIDEELANRGVVILQSTPPTGTAGGSHDGE